MPQPITPTITSSHWSFPHQSFWNSSVAYVCKCPHMFHTILSQRPTMTLEHSNLQFPKQQKHTHSIINPQILLYNRPWLFEFWIGTIDLRHSQSSTRGKPEALTSSTTLEPSSAPNKKIPIALMLPSKWALCATVSLISWRIWALSDVPSSNFLYWQEIKTT